MAALSLAIQQQIACAFAPASKRDAEGTLRDHVLDLEILVDTVGALDPEDLTPELREEIECDLASLIAGTRAKVDRTAAALAMFEAAEEAASAERDRLDKRAKYFARQTARLEAYVLAILECSKLAKLDGHTSTLSMRRNPVAVAISSAATVPAEFMRTPPAPPAPAPVPDKAAIKAALLAGFEIAGCSLERGVKLVRS